MSPQLHHNKCNGTYSSCQVHIWRVCAMSTAAVFLQAYMAVDFFMFLIPFTPGDYLFVGHHMMTFGYMVSSLLINRGGLSCLILMVLGESTSLFQNSWLISQTLKRQSNVSTLSSLAAQSCTLMSCASATPLRSCLYCMGLKQPPLLSTLACTAWLCISPTHEFTAWRAAYIVWSAQGMV